MKDELWTSSSSRSKCVLVFASQWLSRIIVSELVALSCPKGTLLNQVIDVFRTDPSTWLHPEYVSAKATTDNVI